MHEPIAELRAQFDDRAGDYRHSDWHTDYAAGLVGEVPLTPDATVLDAGAGTGMATDAIARRLGPGGRVIAVDLSPAMLRQHRPGTAAVPVGHLIADATRLPLPGSSTDVVVCSAALLYMPVERALVEWHRVLRPGGQVGFSSMRAGQPPAAGLFRTLARARGLDVPDRSARLGSPQACRAALTGAGFDEIRVADGTVRFTARDLDCAWAAHERGHRDLLRAAFDRRALLDFEREYRAAVDANRLDLAIGHVLYAVGRKWR